MSGLLLRGLLSGLIAALLAFGFAEVFGEPSVDRAIAFEAHGHSHDHGSEAQGSADHGSPGSGTAEPELVSRATQSGLGLFTGIVIYGAALGGLFAIAFAFVHGRVGQGAPRATAAWLALAGFVALYLVPWLKYPANPPSVGSAETIGYRTELFFIMVLVSALAGALATALARMSVGRVGPDNSVIVGLAAFVGIVALWGLYLPGVDEVPPDFSATLLWNFRLASLGIQAVLWTGIGILFGLLADRYPRAETDRSRVGGRPAFR